MIEEDKYIMWLNRIEGLEVKKAHNLIKYFGSAKEVWKCTQKALKNILWLSETNIDNIMKSKNDIQLDKYVDELNEKKIDFVSINDKKYPYLLKQIFDPPLGLYVLGNIPNDDLIKVSVIGTRKPTEYGKINAYKFCKEFVENNIVIVSGMAYGLDSIANKAALENNGVTIAVMGCGVDVCYPASNRNLMNKIIEKGCIISEYPPQTPPYHYNFPKRNRIISGLSVGTVVIEAGKKSGTLITVQQALEQGRDIFAMPGNITSEMSRGTNELIKDGAYILTETNDLLQVLGIKKNISNKINNKKISDSLAPEEKLVYDCIDLTPISIDELILKTKSQIQTIKYILTVLELKGFIQKISGQKYIRSL